MHHLAIQHRQNLSSGNLLRNCNNMYCFKQKSYINMHYITIVALIFKSLRARLFGNIPEWEYIPELVSFRLPNEQTFLIFWLFWCACCLIPEKVSRFFGRLATSATKIAGHTLLPYSLLLAPKRFSFYNLHFWKASHAPCIGKLTEGCLL